MKVIYDPQADILRISLSSSSIEDINEERPGIVFNYDDDGNLIGMDILDASQRIDDPRSVEYALLEANDRPV